MFLDSGRQINWCFDKYLWLISTLDVSLQFYTSITFTLWRRFKDKIQKNELKYQYSYLLFWNPTEKEIQFVLILLPHLYTRNFKYFLKKQVDKWGISEWPSMLSIRKDFKLISQPLLLLLCQYAKILKYSRNLFYLSKRLRSWVGLTDTESDSHQCCQNWGFIPKVGFSGVKWGSFFSSGD